ncbi:Tellurite resistance protein TerB [Devosia enhydra]|uniref:Tellurite resistance protein TerB n=1 Tax=Devosia enhydra TaxID=665118 RepID=A0A1K2HXU7_9HYPH|nr:tellurite resistance TerB family protein [Devosia enhydra]SFZ84516.1 Tellurite resistance protein TerB [Devosia enhydra]
MAKYTDVDGAMFSKRPISRNDSERLDVEAGDDPHLSVHISFMEAAVAAGMIIAHADGNASISEHRRIINLLKQHPVLRSFAVDDVAREMETHVIAFAADEATADQNAERRIADAHLTAAQFNALLGMCRSVLEADGVSNPKEVAALVRISAVRAV